MTENPKLPPLPLEQYLAAKELAGYFGMNEDSAYRWISEGKIPAAMIRYCGTSRIRIHPSAIPHLEEVFRAAHDASREVRRGPRK